MLEVDGFAVRCEQRRVAGIDAQHDHPVLSPGFQAGAAKRIAKVADDGGAKVRAAVVRKRQYHRHRSKIIGEPHGAIVVVPESQAERHRSIQMLIEADALNEIVRGRMRWRAARDGEPAGRGDEETQTHCWPPAVDPARRARAPLRSVSNSIARSIGIRTTPESRSSHRYSLSIARFSSRNASRSLDGAVCKRGDGIRAAAARGGDASWRLPERSTESTAQAASATTTSIIASAAAVHTMRRPLTSATSCLGAVGDARLLGMADRLAAPRSGAERRSPRGADEKREPDPAQREHGKQVAPGDGKAGRAPSRQYQP